MKALRAIRGQMAALADAMRLAKPYFSSDERRSAWGLLIAIVALNLALVYLNVVYTYWYKIAYDALQTKTASAFWASMFTYRIVHGFPYFVPGFSEIALFSILAAVYAFYLNQMLVIRWRRWLTTDFVTKWLDRRAYYHLSLEARAGTPLDNPDQRISEDIPNFVSGSLTLGTSVLSNIVTLASFVGVLWSIAPALTIAHVTIPGYLVWCALGYSIAGTWITQLIGRRLIPLTFQQQQLDADFRFGLVRVREHSEQIALYRGEDAERADLATRFASIYRNWWQIMTRTKALNFFTVGFTQIALIFPLIVAVPGYFSGIFTLGVLVQILTIFGNVQSAFSWFVNSYPDIVAWRATVQRLSGFQAAVETARAQAVDPALARSASGSVLRASDLRVDLPDGRSLLRIDSIALERGTPVAFSGASGSGKSTLFRTFAGIWPFAAGRLTLPDAERMFLPQRPYLPVGTIKRTVVYPLLEVDVTDAVVADALTCVGLAPLAADLTLVDSWEMRLSGGEQQRIAFARALIAKPAWLFLDEATSALDEPAGAALFSMLRDRLPATQIVSITHNGALAALHERQISVGQTATLTVAGR
jgi:putative ATP-binding cassette transporter